MKVVLKKEVDLGTKPMSNTSFEQPIVVDYNNKKNSSILQRNLKIPPCLHPIPTCVLCIYLCLKLAIESKIMHIQIRKGSEQDVSVASITTLTTLQVTKIVSSCSKNNTFYLE